MRNLLPLLLAATVLPTAAHAGDTTATPGDITVTAARPGTISDVDRTAYRLVFAEIRSGDWINASAALDARPDGVLTSVARAELFLAKGAPRPDPVKLSGLLAAAPELPEAPALARLATQQGITSVPTLPQPHDLVRLAGASKRVAARPTRSDAAAARLSVIATPLVKANDGAGAEAKVEAVASQLSPEALAEWRQRVAWAYYLANDDVNARRVAASAGAGAGEWTVQANWVLGLSSWRSGEMAAAADAFAAVATSARDAETVAAGLFWAARSDTAGGRPDRVAARLRSAARLDETFYGLLASATLGLAAEPGAAARGDGPDLIALRPNARAAAALTQVGESTLADQLLRQQAKIGPAEEHGALIRLAGTLNLPATQMWLAQNGPVGIATPVSARYPMPAWAPTGGWRVDRALIFAHALQESQFRTDAVSHAGARGLMQLMPGTARLVARHKGETADMTSRLNDPAVSFEYGQSYLEELASNGGTGGLLPKVIAAYNAGPNNVAAWSVRPGASNDPLLFIESMPFAETRAYTAIVLRNYWMYQRESGAPTESLATMAQGKWPLFPVARPRMAVSAAGAFDVAGGS
ncbi:lytic transglycosylase domain-containing protein [Sphingomonas sp. AP4-R1]|uniref:lytic transglycosylase domain-containing protein n=1 Tax=Sphingomonas sp. AP4-R1 TaxID=2735134 RepID=UPI001493B5F9|nr:lytic transglycosylase domain-containing protein [Sphingomonas sp. AP4-R1]QJU59729.1 lytic transglycosylase domain-containing protein [Sphingomonas sp. AP4-R1]